MPIIKSNNPTLSWIYQLMTLFQSKAIVAPTSYRDKVLEVKDVLDYDISGAVNTILDYGIKCALVKYTVDTDNTVLSEILNKWLDNINEDYRGKFPTGLESLAKEYFRERWKGSSQLLLRTFWSKVGGLELPTTMFFVNGEDIVCQAEGSAVVLGSEKYYLRTGTDGDCVVIPQKPNLKGNVIPIPSKNNELIFVQKPFESWGTLEPTPWLIKRGIWHNLKFMGILSEKGEFIVAKAIEYLMAIKKGTEKMFIEGNVSYSKEDLQKVTDDLKTAIDEKKADGKTPTYATQFDTEIEHIIPEYSRILSDSLYAPIERKILAGLGLIDIVQGVASTRRESVLNPKPFMNEVKQGVADFRILLTDIVKEIIARNKSSHQKWMHKKIEVTSLPVTDFFSDNGKTLMRALYDRGLLSKRTATEVLGEIDYDIEKQRRKKETEDKDDKTMEPPMIQNIPVAEASPTSKPREKDKEIPEDKKGPEKKNYDNASLDEITEEEIAEIFEEAPYKKNSDLPPAVKKYPSKAQTAFRRAFNEALKTKDETTAFKIAWKVLKDWMDNNK